eukprot:g40943.t1
MFLVSRVSISLFARTLLSWKRPAPYFGSKAFGGRLLEQVCDSTLWKTGHRPSLDSFGLLLACTAIGGLLQPSKFWHVVNPLGLTRNTWVIAYVIKCCSLALLDQLVDFVIKCFKPNRLGFRDENPRVKGLPRLEWIDYLYLTINSVIEYLFASHVADMVFFWDSMFISCTWSGLTIWNTFPALWLIFAVDDAIYTPAHALMHERHLYPYIHKHHHRQTLPKRGYLDAGNEHPIEQLIGQSALWMALQIVSRLTGLHAVTIVVHFALYAVLALTNHTEWDLRFSGFGFSYTNGAHEMHHRNPDCNRAQYFMIWDKLMGTYEPYRSSMARKNF